MGILRRVSKIWFSEAPLALRTKQAIAAALPRAALVSLKKRYYSSLLKHPGRYMESDAAALKYFIAPGDFVIDVGAFVGFYSALLSQLVGPSGEVWSIEPMPDTFEILSHNVRKLKLRNVHVLNCALSDSRGTTTMEIPHWKGGGESWYDARIVASRSSSSGVTVQTETLDSLHARTARLPTFIKCDVEDHELSCIRGALSVIGRSKPALLVETIQRGDDLAELVRLLAAEGYGAYAFDGTWFEGCQPGQNQNTFFLLPSHLTAAAERRRVLRNASEA
jgi:FkbM family methyltransferase